MRRLASAFLAGLVVAGSVAAGPAGADVDHDVPMAPGDHVTVEGGAPGGVNYTPIVTGGTQPEPTCSKSPEAYCETTLLTLSADVPDDAPRGRLNALLALTLDAVQPVSDFDVYLFESDETGARGARIASSGALAGGQVAPVQDGIFWRCPASDECIDLPVTFRTGGGEQHFLVEVHYAVAPVSYVLDLDLSLT